MLIVSYIPHTQLPTVHSPLSTVHGPQSTVHSPPDETIAVEYVCCADHLNASKALMMSVGCVKTGCLGWFDLLSTPVNESKSCEGSPLTVPADSPFAGLQLTSLSLQCIALFRIRRKMMFVEQPKMSTVAGPGAISGSAAKVPSETLLPMRQPTDTTTCQL